MKEDALLDLFGQPLQRSYRATRDFAHPAKPGTGPDGETCGSCLYLFNRRRGRNYYKCEKIRHNWTFGLASDVRLMDKACQFWKKGVLKNG